MDVKPTDPFAAVDTLETWICFVVAGLLLGMGFGALGGLAGWEGRGPDWVGPGIAGALVGAFAGIALGVGILQFYWMSLVARAYGWTTARRWSLAFGLLIYIYIVLWFGCGWTVVWSAMMRTWSSEFLWMLSALSGFLAVCRWCVKPPVESDSEVRRE